MSNTLEATTTTHGGTMNNQPGNESLTLEELMEDSGQFKCPSCGNWHAPDGSPEPVLCSPSVAL